MITKPNLPGKYKFFDIDFETKSLLDITQVGTYKYATHESTQIHITGFSFDENTIDSFNSAVLQRRKLRKFNRTVRKLLARGYKLRAFNSMFEFLIWNHVGVKQFGFPELQLDQCYCVMAESCASGYPAALSNAAKALGLLDQKHDEGTRLINFFSKPNKEGSFNNPLDHWDKFLQFIAYCEQDVRVQIGISKRLRKLDDYQYSAFLLTETMNLRGLPIDRKMVNGAIKLNVLAKEQANKKVQELTNGQIQSATQSTALKSWLNANGCAIPNLQAATIQKYLLRPEIKGTKFEAILKARQNGSISSAAKYEKALKYMMPDDLVHDFIKYHIAHTGRWGGRGIQIQNFSKPSVDYKSKYSVDTTCKLIGRKCAKRISDNCTSISEALKANTRSMIRAPEGYKLSVADFAQVEARIVMWLANDIQGIKDFAGEGKIYERMAGTIYAVDYRQIYKPSFERDLGKAIVLGCGFGMGADKFYIECHTKYGLDVEKDLAKKGVQSYRKRYGRVPIAWRECERAFINAFQNPGEGIHALNGKLYFYYNGLNMEMALPSGRIITYPECKVVREMDNWGKEKEAIYYYSWNQKVPGFKWVSHKIWGGVIFQNGVQGIAADAMVEGMFAGEKRHYNTIFSVHDEGAALVPDTPHYSYKTYEHILTKNLGEWSKGLLLVAEGKDAMRYFK